MAVSFSHFDANLDKDFIWFGNTLVHKFWSVTDHCTSFPLVKKKLERQSQIVQNAIGPLQLGSRDQIFPRKFLNYGL